MANACPLTSKCPQMCLVGNISAAIESIASKYSFAIHQARESIQWRDLQVLLAVAILPHYVLQFINNVIVNKWRKHPVEFHETRYLSLLCRYICQTGRLGLLVYAGEVFIVFLSGLGVPHLENAPRLLASLVYSLWMAHNIIGTGIDTLESSLFLPDLYSNYTLESNPDKHDLPRNDIAISRCQSH